MAVCKEKEQWGMTNMERVLFVILLVLSASVAPTLAWLVLNWLGVL